MINEEKINLLEDDLEGLIRIKILIPQAYHQEPIINNLAHKYNLNINIFGAVLGANAESGGWFDLLLSGKVKDIKQALNYFQEIHIEIWDQSPLIPETFKLGFNYS